MQEIRPIKVEGKCADAGLGPPANGTLNNEVKHGTEKRTRSRGRSRMVMRTLMEPW